MQFEIFFKKKRREERKQNLLYRLQSKKVCYAKKAQFSLLLPFRSY